MKKLLLALVFIMLWNYNIFAEMAEDFKSFPLLWELTDGDFQIWSDALDVSMDLEDGWLEVAIDTREQIEHDFYTAHLYKNVLSDWSDFDSIAFEFHNLTSEILKMNFVITDSNNTEYRLSHEMPMLALAEGSNIRELLPVQWGTTEIPPDFKGIIQIPNYILGDEILKDIRSMGLSITVPSDTLKSFRISNVNKVPEEYDSLIYCFNIEGDTEIILPIEGESIAFYTVVFNDVYSKSDHDITWKNVSFSLSEELKGINITKDGKLTVNETVENYFFKVYADVNDAFRVVLPVSLSNHWSKELNAGNGEEVHLPKSHELQPIKSENNPLFETNTLYLLRVMCVAAFILVSGLYLFISQKGRFYAK